MMFRLLRKTRYVVNVQGRLQTGGVGASGEKNAILFLFLVPAAIMAMKLLVPGLPLVTEIFSLRGLPHAISGHVSRIMLMSVGAVAVVFFRQTIGLRVLGPVRPVLIALAYQSTGILVATLFVITVMALIAIVRPVLRSARMPYFSRIAIVLSLVALLILVAMKTGLFLGVDQLLAVGLLPVVVLTFAAEGFARTLYNEGVTSACWRAAMTLVLAVGIFLLVSMPGVQSVMLEYPEMILAHMGVIMVITRFMNFKVLHFLNPKPAGHASAKRKAKRKKTGTTNRKIKVITQTAI